MARDLDPFKLSSPRIFLIRMMVFLILCGLLGFVLLPQIQVAFMANPALNGLIIGVLLVGIVFAFRQVTRLFPEVNWVNSFRLADPGLAVAQSPVLLAPMASILGDRIGRMAISSQTMRSILDSIATRLDEARDLSRYMTSLLVFLGLLGTFWGLIETVSSVGKVIGGLSVGADAGSVFDTLKEGLAAPLGGMGIAFSSSLFGLAGSLVLGFLDLQSSQAQNRFYMELEDWLSTTVRDLAIEADPRLAGSTGEIKTIVERLKDTLAEGGSNKAATAAMANLAEAIHGLVSHMRSEQQMIRDWADAQASQNHEMQLLLRRIAGEDAPKV
ncbi:MAG: flagellar motor protein MotA [Bradyrhizobiaceae bacterium]|nr:MAG: flagellar motor protein MotA [Bradyrhizobiaceae bacterium]